MQGLSERKPENEGRADPGPYATCRLDVSGMDCASCAQKVERAVRALEGVEDVRVDLIGESVTVRYAGDEIAQGDLVGAVHRAGYRVKEAAALRKEIFEVAGMDCADEVHRIEGTLGNLPGISRLAFDVVARRLTVEGEIAAGEVERAIARLGMKARLVGGTREDARWWARHGRQALAALSGVLFATSLLADHLLGVQWLAGALATAAIAAGGWYIVPRGIRAASNRALDMNFLMSIAAFGALIIGEYEEAASAMFLFAVAQLLEAYSMDRARNAIRALMDLSPAEATVLRNDREERVPVDQVAVGEVVLVRPGEKIPVDGEVLAGCSSVNQAPITGESVSVDKEPGAEVFAGTLNGEGTLEVRSARPAADTTIARILHSVEEAQASRAPSQSFVDRFARVYTPAVVAVAILVVVVPPLVGLGSWGEWFYRSLVLLVVACPCALVISTPVTVVSALAGAARQGILIKGGLHLENTGRARVVALDKTGTLTSGQPEVVEVVAFDGADSRDVLALAAAAESRSEHPLARAILRRAGSEGIHRMPASDTRAIPGKGLLAQVNGRIVYAGSERLFADGGPLGDGIRQVLARFESQGRTAVLIGSESSGEDRCREIHGAIAIADQVRPQASGALHDLHRAGIRRIVMLTGDNRGTARAVATELGVDDYRAELLPEDKVEAVRQLRREYGHVLMVGDGVNDAPALAVADVGIAMGSAGTDVALETADIALMTDDLSRVATTIRIARKAERIIRRNIWFSLLTKGVFVVLALLGLATLWMAVFADMGASLLVVLNGLRAARE